MSLGVGYDADEQQTYNLTYRPASVALYCQAQFRKAEALQSVSDCIHPRCLYADLQ